MSAKRDHKPLPPSLITPITRRSLLRGISAGAAALALPALRTVDAQTGTGAKRFINFFVANGIVPTHYYPNGARMGAQPFDEAWLQQSVGSGGHALSPLLTRKLANGDPIYNKATVIEGINFGVAAGYGSPAHGRGGISMLSGGQYSGGGWDRPSVDQVIAAHHAGSQGAPHRAIFLNADTTRKNSGERESYSWKLDGSPVREISDPTKAVNNLFDASDFGTGGEPAPEVDTTQVGILSANRAHLALLRSRLGSVEASHLDAHLNALDELERRLTAGPLTPVGTCNEPTPGRPLARTSRGWTA